MCIGIAANYTAEPCHSLKCHAIHWPSADQVTPYMKRLVPDYKGVWTQCSMARDPDDPFYDPYSSPPKNLGIPPTPAFAEAEWQLCGNVQVWMMDKPPARCPHHLHHAENVEVGDHKVEAEHPKKKSTLKVNTDVAAQDHHTTHSPTHTSSATSSTSATSSRSSTPHTPHTPHTPLTAPTTPVTPVVQKKVAAVSQNKTSAASLTNTTTRATPQRKSTLR